MTTLDKKLEEALRVEGNANYSITSDGQVYSWITRKWLKLGATNQGYMRVMLSKEGINKRYLVHRLVAESYIPNPDSKPCVNHIDNDPTNNNFENLEWVTQGKTLKTHCNKGHELSGDNLGKIQYTSKDTGKQLLDRRCQECNRVRTRKYYWQRKLKILGGGSE